MKFAKLSVASACVLVVGCGGSSQSEEPVSPDSAVTLEQVERFDQAERVRWAQSDSTAPQMAVTTQTAVDASGSVGISGTVTDNKAVYSVNWTNDRGGSGRAALAGSATSATWSAAGIQLQTGSNTITLVAEDVAGNSTKTTAVVSRSTSAAASPAASPAAPASVSGGSKPAAVTRTVTCANGTTMSQAAGYYASGSNWLLGSFMPQCASGVATPVSAPAPAPVSVVTAPAPAPAPAAAPAPAPATAAGLVAATITFINASLVPAASAVAFSDRRITVTGEMPYRDPDGMGAFRTVCQYSHMAYDDPLVFPGRVGASHLHVFFGNTATSGLSTPESIRTTGSSSCRGGVVNRSAYWVPAMIDSSNGRPITPSEDIDVYYKTGYGLFGQNDAVTPFPRNFRMIAGDSKSRTPQSGVGHFDCNGAISNGIPNCTSGVLMHIVEFPHCWDGTNLDSPDHRSHVVYPSNGACPATHPVHLPQVSFRVKYAANGTSNWRLSSDISGTPAGSTSHGDWVHGWEQEVMDTFVARVIRQGLSGGSHIVGDGRVIY